MSRLAIHSGAVTVAELDGVTIEEIPADPEEDRVSDSVVAKDSEGNVVASMQLHRSEGNVHYGFRAGSAENMRWEVDGAPTSGGNK